MERNKNINVYVLLGEENMGKSSVIKCLTGVGIQSLCRIKPIIGNDRDIFVKVKSLQEGDLTEAEFEELINNYKKNIDDVLICLRINGLINKKSGRYLNPAQNYIEHFRKIGWNVVRVVDFQDLNNLVPLGAIMPTLRLNNTNRQELNLTASYVREHFNWI